MGGGKEEGCGDEDAKERRECRNEDMKVQR
jgi:hypothetical protein